MKVTEKTPKLEDPYLYLCNSILPHLYTIGKVLQLDKNFQKTPKYENAQKYPKNEFFDVYMSFLKETRVRMRVAIYNSHICLKYATFYITTRVCDCFFCNSHMPPENVKKLQILKFG